MRHVDADVLALLALGEQAGDAEDREHLAQCEACAAELAEYARTAAVGRSTIDAGELLEPHPRVWDRIAADVRAADGAPVAEAPVAEAPVAVVTPIRRRWVGLVVAGAAALVAVGIVLTQVLAPAPSTVLASA